MSMDELDMTVIFRLPAALSSEPRVVLVPLPPLSRLPSLALPGLSRKTVTRRNTYHHPADPVDPATCYRTTRWTPPATCHHHSWCCWRCLLHTPVARAGAVAGHGGQKTTGGFLYGLCSLDPVVSRLINTQSQLVATLWLLEPWSPLTTQIVCAAPLDTSRVSRGAKQC